MGYVNCTLVLWNVQLLMEIVAVGVVMAQFELKLIVSEAKCTDQPFWTIPECYFDP